MSARDREWNYTEQRKPGYVDAPHVLTGRQWRRIMHKDYRRADFDPALPASHVYKVYGKLQSTPRQKPRRDG